MGVNEFPLVWKAGILLLNKTKTKQKQNSMAQRALNTLPGTLTFKDRLPRNRYVVRCIEEVFGPSKSSGNPMITRTWEIVHPESVLVNGVPKIVSGVEVQQYLTVMVLGEDRKRDDAKSDKALARLRDENKNLGLPAENIDDEQPELCCVGVVADAVLSADESVTRLDPTPEQLAAGQKFGDPIKDEAGNDVKTFRVKLESILGRSSMAINAPY